MVMSCKQTKAKQQWDTITTPPPTHPFKQSLAT